MTCENKVQKDVTISYGDPVPAQAADELVQGLKRLFPEQTFRVEAGDKGHGDIHLAMTPAADVPDDAAQAVEAVLSSSQDAYTIQSFKAATRPAVYICGNRKRSVYYAVYDYLRRCFGVFYDFHEDLYPAQARNRDPVARDLAVLEISSSPIRGYKPQMLGNYSDRHSPWAFGPERWEQVVKWCVRQRFNVLHLMYFAQGNWIRFDCATEAQGSPDPYMTTDERIAMARHVIDLCHAYGLEAWIGYCTNASTFNYVNAHPEQQSSAGSTYQGYLCWDEGHDHLLDVARETIDTYSEADAVVLWPHEHGCTCSACEHGESFVRLLNETYDYIKASTPRKKVYLLDWHFPEDRIRHVVFLERHRDRLPAFDGILNVHVDYMLESELSQGYTVIQQDCVANWDTSTCLLISPNLREMVLRDKSRAAVVAGFEGHHVSMWGGEYTIDAYGDLTWNPAAFSVTLYQREYIQAVYGEHESDIIADIYDLLETASTAPFHDYTGLPLCDPVTPELLVSERVSGVNHSYRPADGYLVMAGGPADRLTALNTVRMGVTSLARAHELASRLTNQAPMTEYLKASAEVSCHYSRWIERKLSAVLDAREAAALAGQGRFAEAQELMKAAIDTFEQGVKAYDRTMATVQQWPRYFHAVEGISHRGLIIEVTDLALSRRRKKRHSASIHKVEGRGALGVEGFRALLQHMRNEIGARRQPDLTSLARGDIPGA